MTDKTILIVEDEDAIRQMVAFGLKRAGFAPLEAADVATMERVRDTVLALIRA